MVDIVQAKPLVLSSRCGPKGADPLDIAEKISKDHSVNMADIPTVIKLIGSWPQEVLPYLWRYVREQKFLKGNMQASCPLLTSTVECLDGGSGEYVVLHNCGLEILAMLEDPPYQSNSQGFMELSPGWWKGVVENIPRKHVDDIGRGGRVPDGPYSIYGQLDSLNFKSKFSERQPRSFWDNNRFLMLSGNVENMFTVDACHKVLAELGCRSPGLFGHSGFDPDYRWPHSEGLRPSLREMVGSSAAPWARAVTLAGDSYNKDGFYLLCGDGVFDNNEISK